MSDRSPHSRVSRSRRVIALMAWGFLVGTAFLLWNAQQTGTFRSTAAEPIAFLLAAFGAFVGVFAWMLFNPNHRTTAESPSLFLAAAVTLFPPPVIGFCLMPHESPLRWWLALGIFLLVVIAILSHVPDEFFGVPRGRHSYVVPLPAFDRVSHSVMDPNASWFTFNDLSTIVADGKRPSLAPRSYLNRDQARRTAPASPERRIISDVDDILGSDYEIGLLDDAPLDLNTKYQSTSNYSQADTGRPLSGRSKHGQPSTNAEQSPTNRSTTPIPALKNPSSDQQRHSAPVAQRQKDTQQQPPHRDRSSAQPSVPVSYPKTQTAPQYSHHNPESGHLQKNQQVRIEGRQPAPMRHFSVAQRHAGSLKLQTQTARTSSEAFNLVPAAQPPKTSGHSTQNQVANTSSSNSIDFDIPDTVSISQHSDFRSPKKKVATDGSAFQEQIEPVPAILPAVSRTATEDGTAGESYRRERRDTSKSTRQPTTSSQPQKLRGDSANRTPSSPSTKSSLTAGTSLFGIPVAYTAASEVTESTNGDHVQKSTGSANAVHAPPQRSTPETARSEHTTGNSRPASRYDQPQPDSTPARLTDSAAEISAVTRADRAAISIPTKDKSAAIERTKADDGSELVEGVMKVRFDKGQKRANLHVPFSPPLPGTPDVECECVDDSALRLKVPVRQSYGIRIEARRTNADQPLEADIGFAAVYNAE